MPIASCSDEPPSILALTSINMFFMRGLLLPFAMMSMPCTIGTPAAIITAIWRLNTAMSRAPVALPADPNRGLPLGLTDSGLMPCRRNSALTMLAFFAA